MSAVAASTMSSAMTAFQTPGAVSSGSNPKPPSSEPAIAPPVFAA